MKYEEWNAEEVLHLELWGEGNPLRRGVHEWLDALLSPFENLGEELRPSKVAGAKGRYFRYSRQRARQLLLEATADPGGASLWLSRRPASPEVEYKLGFIEAEDVLEVGVRQLPLSFFREPGRQEQRARQIIEWVRQLASNFPLRGGEAHGSTDWCMVHVSEESALSASLTQLYLTAARLAGSPA